MAKKARTPPPPRRPVQAPKQRTTQRTPVEKRTILYVLAFVALGILLVGGVLAVVAFGGGGGSASGALIATNSCTEQQFKGLKPAHLNTPDAPVAYDSFPPSSGPHYASPAPWGIYPDSIKQTILVHNLEHGGIVIQYGTGVSKSDVEKLQSFYQDDPYGLVVAPYKKLGSKIAATAWNEPAYDQNTDANFNKVDPGHGYVLMCSSFDKGALSKFRDKRRNKAGERYQSIKDMTPGQ